MKMTEASVRQLARMMRSMGAQKDDGLAILLTLETEENVQEFFDWSGSLGKDPTWQECFEKAVAIWEENGPDPER